MAKLSTFPKRIIMTGASGTLGCYLLRALVKRPSVRILLLARSNNGLERLPKNCQVNVVDFSDRAALTSICLHFKPNAIVHAAAAGMKSEERADWLSCADFNVNSSLHLLNAAARVADCHFVHLSTALVYQPQQRALVEVDPLGPSTVYGATKAAAEMLLQSGARSLDVPLTVCRPFSFTGMRDHERRLFPSILRAASAGTTAKLSSGNQVRDYCSAEDVASAIVAALSFPSKRGEVRLYNIGSGHAMPVRDLVKMVVREIGLDVHLDFASPSSSDSNEYLIADIGAAARDLNWRPLTSVSYAVWELAQSSHPLLDIRKPLKTSFALSSCPDSRPESAIDSVS